MGLFDIVGEVFSTPFDMMGISRHARDQQIEQQNQRELMALENHYHDKNFATEFAAENKEWWNRYTQTQSPAAQARQYRQIGVNPSAMIQNGSGGFHQTPVQTTVPSPPNITPPSQGQIYQGGNNTDLLGDIAKMELNEAQKDEIYALLKGKMREQEDAHELAQIMRAQKEFTLGLDRVYGSDERANKLANLVQEGLVLYLQGQEAEKNAKFLEAKTILSDDEHVLNKQQLPLLKLYLEAMIQATKAKATESFSSAKLNEVNSELLKNENRIRKIAADIREVGSAKEVLAVLSELDAKNAISQEQYKEAVISCKKLQNIIETYGNDAGRAAFDAELQNFFRIIGLSTSIHN